MKAKNSLRIAGFLRISMVAVAVILQVALIVLLIQYLRNYSLIAYFVIIVASIIETIVLVSRNRASSYTIAWLILILGVPVLGFFLYALWGRDINSSRGSRKIIDSIARGNNYIPENSREKDRLTKAHPRRRRISEYLVHNHFPPYENTKCGYFPLGELQFEAMLADMEKAKRFIFLEYFILNDGKIWDSVKEVLIRKAAQGVEVRLLFDDMGSIITAPDGLIRDLAAHGIAARRFNPIHRHISRMFINYRNHQKITVIDGNVGYTGGTNLADEYANIYPKHGHWKDTAIRLEGDAVWGLSIIFLQMWDVGSKTDTDYNLYRPTKSAAGRGFFQPFADGPVNNPSNPAQVMYQSIIANALDYVYITTPYLVIENSMADCLCTAAKGGVDVRIITPKIWDHWYVHMVTQSNYKRLLEAGVRIYEYTPGYIHAKTIISDDDHCVTGSINMDYRSFYLHFENGVWICGAPVLKEIKNDIMKTFDLSEEIFLEKWNKRPWYRKLLQSFMRIFAVMF